MRLIAILLIASLCPAQESILLAAGQQIANGTPAGTWTMVQHVSNFTCTNNTCSVNMTSTAGNLVVILSGVFNSGGQPTFTSLTGDSPTHCSSAGGFVNYSASNYEATDCGYVLSSSGGTKTYDFTWSGGVVSDIEVIEYHRSSGTAALDSQGTATTSSSCSSCVGPTVTVTGTDVVVEWTAVSNSCSAVSGSFTNPFDSDANVAGYFAGALNQSSNVGATWTCVAGGASMSGISFK